MRRLWFLFGRRSARKAGAASSEGAYAEALMASWVPPVLRAAPRVEGEPPAAGNAESSAILKRYYANQEC